MIKELKNMLFMDSMFMACTVESDCIKLSFKDFKDNVILIELLEVEHFKMSDAVGVPLKRSLVKTVDNKYEIDVRDDDDISVLMVRFSDCNIERS